MSFLRQALLSLLVIAAALGGWYFYDPGSGPANGSGAGGETRSEASAHRAGGVPVVTARVGTDDAGAQLRAIGTLEAAKAVTLFPEVVGIVAEIGVKAGATVTQGDVIFRLDDADQEVAVERAEIAVETARDALGRAEQLARSRNITEVALSDARTALRSAEIDLRSAQIERDKRHVKAPFDGVVGLIPVTVGDLVGTSTALTTLDDLSLFTVAFDAPERFISEISIGHPVTGASVGAPGREIRGEITAVDSRVDATTRLFKIEATLREGISGLKPGMSITVTADFPGEPHTTVPSLAVQWDRQGAYVWTLDGDAARRVPVQILGRSSGTVIIAAELEQGQEVVVEGLQRMREGIAVTRVGGESDAATAGAASGPPDGSDGAVSLAEESESGEGVIR